ncbi:hypothetical protein SD457_01130 [Coprobacillaceae bacterium CR2/5/TPMF4]|nr:hypothetical protein SD457_01130 [Coprobacillaceae bacterium CR2/5/TPMF4]
MMQRSKNLQRRQNDAIAQKKELLKDVETVESLKMMPLTYSKKR